MPRCPVCNIFIPPFQEHCDNCMCSWELGQKDCPATVRNSDKLVIARCNLGFNHTDRKHRAIGFRFFDNGPEFTLLWWYPENEQFRARSREMLAMMEEKSWETE